MLSYFGPHNVFYSSFKPSWNQISEPLVEPEIKYAP